MNIRLLRLEMNNFKGLKHFSAKFDGNNAVITGENGAGKTTVYDAFLWLLFDKDSTGRKQFDLRPLRPDNHVIEGLVLTVEADLEIDGIGHTYKKEHKEKTVRGVVKGYETLCWIDEVPKKVSEYAAAIAAIVSEDTFRGLTNLQHFLSELHWTARREVLLDVAGNIGRPKGFDALLGELYGRSLEDYRKVLLGQKVRLTKERDEIGPRIDELQKSLPEYAGADTAAATVERDAILKELGVLEDSRSRILASEGARQRKMNDLNGLVAQRTKREAFLESDTSAVANELGKKTLLDTVVEGHKRTTAQAKANLTATQEDHSVTQGTLQRRMRELETIRTEYKGAAAETEADTCYACGQKLPAEKLVAAAQAKEARLKALREQGNNLKTEVDGLKVRIETIQQQITAFTTASIEAQAQLKQAEAHRTKRFAEIDELVKACPRTQPADDVEWRRLNNLITAAEKEIGPSLAEQLEAVNGEISLATGHRDELNVTLARADQIAAATKRITELGEQEKALGCQIAEIDGKLAQIDAYTAAESALITQAVNGKFRHVEFKLFKELLNGGIEPCCEAMLNGVPYADMSCGQRIVAGVDVINVLSEHFGVSVPLFVDNAESLTLPLEATGQAIRLFAKPGQKSLKIETQVKEKAVA